MGERNDKEELTGEQLDVGVRRPGLKAGMTKTKSVVFS